VTAIKLATTDVTNHLQTRQMLRSTLHKPQSNHIKSIMWVHQWF